MDYSLQKNKTIILKSSKKVRQISIENITYISCDSYLISIHLFNQQKPEIFSTSLKEIENELSYFHFLRINRNELINMKYFKSYHDNGSRNIILSTGSILSVSRRQWLKIKNYF